MLFFFFFFYALLLPLSNNKKFLFSFFVRKNTMLIHQPTPTPAILKYQNVMFNLFTRTIFPQNIRFFFSLIFSSLLFISLIFFHYFRSANQYWGVWNVFVCFFEHFVVVVVVFFSIFSPFGAELCVFLI